MRTNRAILPVLFAFASLLALSAALAFASSSATSGQASAAPALIGAHAPAVPTSTPCSGSCFTQSTAGTVVPGTSFVTDSDCDDCAVGITLPFAIHIGSSSYMTTEAVSNGHLDFEKPELDFQNTCLPATTLHTAIFAHWDDLDMRLKHCALDCGIYTGTAGTAPNRTFDIEWRARLYTDTVQPVNFEVRFFEAQPERFDIIYGTMSNSGRAATVGLQDGSTICQFECNAGGLTEGLVLSYRACATCNPTFTDVLPGSTFYEFVRCVFCRGAIGGYPDGTFRPSNPATRGQMTKILVLAFGITINDKPPALFSDVPVGSTFFSYVQTAARAQIVGGYPDGTFRPGNNVTRGQLSKIIVNGAVIVNGWTLINPPNASFSDVAFGSAFYQFVETAVCHQIIGGYPDATFRPSNTATRGQISKIVCLAAQNQGVCNPPGVASSPDH